ncbi:chlorophyll A-B binding protein [Aureococcus anophagefferens]|nr:chlorophyll A-B binding protein [Aureococcus anophagefferens]
MGKGRRGAKRSWNDDASPDTELRAAKHAARFAAFYKRQLLGDTLADDAEWDVMMAAMKRPLPVTFRITAAGGLAQRIEAELGELTNRCNGVAALAAQAAAGPRSWAVFDDGPTELDAPPLIEYATHGDVPEKRQSRFKPSHFPPAEEAVREALRRCMRFVPHDDDTGGFFVTVLRKGGAAPEPAAEAAEPPAAEPAAPDAAPAPAPKIKDDAEREGKKAKVHMEDLGNDASKKVLLVSPAAKRLVLRAKDHKLRVVHAGVVALQRTSASARGVVDYRLSQDGIDLVLPFMTKRKVKCSAADFALLTDGGAKRIADLSVAAVSADAGGLAFYLDGDEPPALVAWKGNAGHVTAFAAKDDLTVLKSKLEALGVEEARKSAAVSMQETKQDLMDLQNSLPGPPGFYDPLGLADQSFVIGMNVAGDRGCTPLVSGEHKYLPYRGYVAGCTPQEQWDNIPLYGKLQIFTLIGMLESYGEGAGSPEGYSAEQKARLKVELLNGRAAQFGILGLLAESKVPGSVPFLSQIEGFPKYAGDVMAPFSGDFTLGLAN